MRLTCLQAGGWRLRPTAVLLPPHPSTAAGGLPSMELPSDHIPLLARFEVAAAHPGAEAGPGRTVAGNAPGDGAGEWAGTRTASHKAAAAAAGARAAAGSAAAARTAPAAKSAPGGDAGTGSGQLNGDSSSKAGAEPQHQHAPKFVGIGTVL